MRIRFRSLRPGQIDNPGSRNTLSRRIAGTKGTMYSGSPHCQAVVNGLNLGGASIHDRHQATMVYRLLPDRRFAHGDGDAGACVLLFIVTNAFLPEAAWCACSPSDSRRLVGVAYRPRGARRHAQASLAVSWIIQNGAIMGVTARKLIPSAPGVNPASPNGRRLLQHHRHSQLALAVGLMARSRSSSATPASASPCATAEEHALRT